MKLAVFDIDGTLIHGNRVEDDCFVTSLRTLFGFEGIDSEWTTYEDVTDSGLVNQLCLDHWGRLPSRAEMREFREVYSRSLIARLEADDGKEIAGASSFLLELRANPEWRIAVATGNFLRLALHKFRHAGLSGFDLPMATADDAPKRTELVRLAIARAQEEYGVSRFRHVVSVGDAPWDLKAARELHMPFVAIGERCGTRSSGSAILTDYTDAEAVLLHLAEAVCW